MNKRIAAAPISDRRFHSAQIRISCIRHCEAPQGAVAIRFFRISHLLQICGFAGLFIVLSSVLGTPLSLLVQRKLQRKHTKAGREKSPRLAIHPSARRKLSLSIIRRRACRRSAALLMKCFVLEIQVLSPMKRAEKDSSACSLRMTKGGNACHVLSF